MRGEAEGANRGDEGRAGGVERKESGGDAPAARVGWEERQRKIKGGK